MPWTWPSTSLLRKQGLQGCNSPDSPKLEGEAPVSAAARRMGNRLVTHRPSRSHQQAGFRWVKERDGNDLRLCLGTGKVEEAGARGRGCRQGRGQARQVEGVPGSSAKTPSEGRASVHENFVGLPGMFFKAVASSPNLLVFIHGQSGLRVFCRCGPVALGTYFHVSCLFPTLWRGSAAPDSWTRGCYGGISSL